MKILKSYKFEMFVPFGDAAFVSNYELTFSHSYLFGLIKKESKAKYSMPSFQDETKQMALWDYLIKNKIRL